MKVVRELGLERRETVWSLSAIIKKIIFILTSVRKDWEVVVYSIAIINMYGRHTTPHTLNLI